jgi:hypothetical protein
MEPLSRRNFIHIAAGTAVLGLASSDAGAQRSAGFPGSLCFFSKHLPRMNGRELGRSLEALGFDGVDLTVRPGGTSIRSVWRWICPSSSTPSATRA